MLDFSQKSDCCLSPMQNISRRDICDVIAVLDPSSPKFPIKQFSPKAEVLPFVYALLI